MARGPGARYDEQIEALADAAVRMVERDGIAGLTFRKVAEEAGVSPGRVQHYFRNRRGLAAATFRHIRARITRVIEEGLGAAVETPTVRDLVVVTLNSLIPQNERQVADLRVAHLVELHAMQDEDLAAELRSGRADLISFLADRLASARNPQPDSEDTSARRIATVLLATAEGLSSMVLSGHLRGDEARRLLEASVAQALEHFCLGD